MGWREILQPALSAGGRPEVGLWPFDGALDELLADRDVVICETYPAEAYRRVGLMDGGSWSRRRVEDRRRLGSRLNRWFRANTTEMALELVEPIATGFGDDEEGEDRFDAKLGLMLMLEVVDDRIGEGGRHLSQETRKIEGWILGRS